MLFYDIHTHQPSIHAEDKSIINRIIGKEEAISYPPEQWLSVGVHPWYIYNNVKEQLSELESMLQSPSVLAIGEAGLDKTTDTPLPLQQAIFTEQAAMAEHYGKPLIIHCVKAWSELIANKRAIHPRMPWIIHGFRGNGELAKQLIQQGFYLSFSASFNPQAVHVAYPERLLIETDDKAIDIRTVYQNIAEIVAISLDELTDTVEKSVQNVFFQ